MPDEKTGTGSPEAVPEALKAFVDATGKMDMQKLAQSYSEAQKKITDVSQESIAAKRAYEELLATAGMSSVAPAAAKPDPTVTGRKPLTVDQLVTNPEQAIDSRIDEKTSTSAKQVTEALLAIEHPELARDEEGKFAKPEFVDGLLKYAKTLPPTTRMAMAQGDYATAAHVIRTYKALQRKAAEQVGSSVQTEKPNFSESGKSSTTRKPGKVWTRSEIREMIARKPEEYRKNEAEIDKAYEEDRVDFSR